MVDTARGPAGSPDFVVVADVSVAFGPVRALEGIELSVAGGELLGLTGESGAGKTTLMRCIAGDLTPTAGKVLVDGSPGPQDPGAAARAGMGVVWQDLALVDKLDVAANLLLGREGPGLLWSEARTHAAARRMLDDLDIPIRRTTDRAGELVAGERQLLAIARAFSVGARILLLDEPTAALGIAETAQVERLIRRIHEKGTTVVVVSHDVEQLIRLTQRIVVLRRGRVVSEVESARAHRDDVIALLSGQEPEASAHHQLTRLQALTDQLASADPSSSLLMILTALGAALGMDRLCMHVASRDDRLHLACSVGVPTSLQRLWAEVPFGSDGGAVGVAAATVRPVVEAGEHTARSARAATSRAAGAVAWWSVPFTGAKGLAGVITVLRDTANEPTPDELDLVTLYGGYAASAIERDRLLGELTSRNLVLETIREVLERLAGPAPVAEALEDALRALLHGVEADEIGLFARGPGHGVVRRAHVRADGAAASGPGLDADVVEHRRSTAATGRIEPLRGPSYPSGLAVSFPGAEGMVTLAAARHTGEFSDEARTLLEDAASSLRLALEREGAQVALQEAAALRRSQELQRQFLARLSHELRTPLTAIGGYADSLMQPDVTWDQESHDRFLSRIGAESTRLRRLVGDLLDHSAIESGVLRLHCDWCHVSLLLDAARACLDPAAQERVALTEGEGLPAIWADHDRLEQVFLNLMDNAIRHNPPDTRVWVDVTTGDSDTVRVVVQDDGAGPPDAVVASPFTPHRENRSRSAGAGLGLSIAHAIVLAHGGTIELERAEPGTRFVIMLPAGNDATGPREPEEKDMGLREVSAHG